MLLELAVVAAFLVFGNLAFGHFEPKAPWWRRVLKGVVVFGSMAAISHFFGRRGVVIAFVIALLPVIYVHGIWLPRHGVNGWTGEPREKYHALRGWPPPER